MGVTHKNVPMLIAMCYNYAVLTYFKGKIMKTEVIMKRELFNMPISQKSISRFFSATDLVRAGNKWRLGNGMDLFNINEYFRLKGTVEFISELQKKYGEVKISRRGRSKDTWVHPILFIDIALAISPTLKIEVYEWIFDNLIKYRNESGDSYKKMAGYLYAHTANRSNFYKEISAVAEKIKLACGVEDWQTAKENQLIYRDKIQDSISLLSDVLRDNNEAVRIAILKTTNY
jgi:hypothetical protein